MMIKLCGGQCLWIEIVWLYNKGGKKNQVHEITREIYSFASSATHTPMSINDVDWNQLQSSPTFRAILRCLGCIS